MCEETIAAARSCTRVAVGAIDKTRGIGERRGRETDGAVATGKLARDGYGRQVSAAYPKIHESTGRARPGAPRHAFRARDRCCTRVVVSGGRRAGIRIPPQKHQERHGSYIRHTQTHSAPRHSSAKTTRRTSRTRFSGPSDVHEVPVLHVHGEVRVLVGLAPHALLVVGEGAPGVAVEGVEGGGSAEEA
ncbi:hypothetical protein BV22DRAFT_1038130 [Leucogyrophana mollusca]|uniref:Uncharacterized protein n=1 Tax=Leucogyrophana mollusca TaxID=85980 RepID=A0ACB8B976_9AGAM|nr:hypothetical protein BV22DRAFT_1038130 [Leucogyrophana mollusca]